MFGTRRTGSPSTTTTCCDERRSWTRPRDDGPDAPDDGPQDFQRFRRGRPHPLRPLLRRHGRGRGVDPRAARGLAAGAAQGRGMTRSDLVRDGAVLTGGARRGAKLFTVPGLDVRPALARMRNSIFQVL